jgi:hypothetical protein
MGVPAVPVKPPLPSERRRIIQRRVLSHDQYRKLGHLYGYIDPMRTWRARIAIGNASWLQLFFGIFGDPTILLSYAPLYTARIIRFPERRSEIVKLKAELDEVKQAIARTTLTARAKAEVMVVVGSDWR